MQINTRILCGAMQYTTLWHVKKCDSCGKRRSTTGHMVEVSVWIDDRPEHRIVKLPLGDLCRECAAQKQAESMSLRQLEGEP